MKHRSAMPKHPMSPQSRKSTEDVPPNHDESSRVVARPDGHYWIADDGRQEFGPFSSVSEALRALRSGQTTEPEPEEVLAEVEAEMGIVDPASHEGGVEEE
jgi:hypothetical protein